MPASRSGKADAGARGKTRPSRANRREELLAKAAELFATRGFDGTSMRDIASAVDMLPGSLYYHFASKEELLLTIHDRVVSDMFARVEGALAEAEDPWDRLERAAVAHLEGLLEYGTIVTIISPNFPREHAELNRLLTAHRDRYEAMFRDLVDALALRPGIDRRLLRLQLLGALNWVPVWYAPGGAATPETIARGFVAVLREGAAA